MEPDLKAEEVIGGERVPIRDSVVKSIGTRVILEAKLSVGSENSFLITLTKEKIFFSRPDDKGQLQVTSTIELKDILAVEGINEAHFKINNAPRRPAHFVLHTFRWKDEKREKRKYAKLLVICADPAEKDRWVQRIDLLLRSHPESMHNKRFKVLVNPFSGSKTAVKIWQQCEALFKLSGVRYDVTNTAYPRHAKEIASQIDLKQYHAIVTVSGDGLLNEVINGLMERSDWQRALSLHLGAIPAGSGNGLARSVGTVDPVTTTFEMLKGKRRKMDLLHVVQAKSSSYCFLSVTWALIADIDLESESYRWMGEPRFTVAAVGLIASPRSYKGRISWLPVEKIGDGAAASAGSSVSPPPSVATSPPTTGPVLPSLPSPLSPSSPDPVSVPAAASASVSAPISPPVPSSSSSPSPPELEPISRSQPDPAKTASSLELPVSLSPLSLSGAATAPPAALPEPIVLSSTSQLSPDGRLRDIFLEAGVSAERGWVIQEGNWSVCVASNVTHLSSTALIAPQKKWGEGCVDLILSTSTERTDLLSILLNLEDGTFVKKTPAVTYHKARAFVIEPLCKDGLFSLDGERTEYSTLRGEVHPGALTILG